MQVSVENTGGLERRMTIQVPAERIDQEVGSRLESMSRTVRLDGFRPGKVPVRVIRQKYGEQVRQEVIEQVINATLQEALSQENLSPAGMPSIVPQAIQPGEALEYVATFEVFPEFTGALDYNFSVTRPVVEVRDEDVDAMLEKLRKQRVTWTKVERPAAEGDRLEIDFQGTIDGQSFSGNSASNVPLELGSGAMIPGFEEQLTGSSAGDRKTIEVTFPTDYASKEVAGKTAQFDVSVNAVAEAVLPELDDAFAKTFGVGDGGLDKLREEVRRNMHRELDAAVRNRVKQQVFESLLAKADIDVPAALIDQEVAALIKKEGDAADAGADRSRYEQEAKRRICLGLLIAELIKRHQLQVDPERVRETIEALAQSYEKPEEVVQWYYSNQDMLAGIQTLVMEDTVVEWVADQAKTEEKAYTFEELMQA